MQQIKVFYHFILEIYLTGQFAHISVPKFFPNMGFVQEYSKSYKHSL